MRSLLLGVMAGSAVISAALAIGATPASPRSLATCSPTARVPAVWPPGGIGTNPWDGYALGDVNCDSGAPSWYYTIRLANHAGSTLTESSGGPASGGSQVSTATVVCTGAIVHSFLYINVGGTGKSDTSGEVNCFP